MTTQLLSKQVRTEEIDKLVKQATKRGDCTDRLYWTLVYDFEYAPMTTNLAQLEEAGLIPLDAESLFALYNDEEVHSALWNLIRGLENHNIFLLHSNHLTDQALYVMLTKNILVEPVRDLPSDAGVDEFIDLIGGRRTEDREIFQRFYASESERNQFKVENGYEIAQESPISNRDCDLPRPKVVPFAQAVVRFK